MAVKNSTLDGLRRVQYTVIATVRLYKPNHTHSTVSHSIPLFIVSVRIFLSELFLSLVTAAQSAPLTILIPEVESFDQETATETFKGSRSADPHHPVAGGGGLNTYSY